MASEKKKLTYSFFVGGKPVDKLTPEQCEKMAQRIGEALSTYYTAHPDEYQRIASNNQSTK